MSVVRGRVAVRRRGVPMINRSMRRCVRRILVVRSVVVVQLAHPYSIVGVIVASNRCSRARSG